MEKNQIFFKPAQYGRPTLVDQFLSQNCLTTKFWYFIKLFLPFVLEESRVFID